MIIKYFFYFFASIAGITALLLVFSHSLIRSALLLNVLIINMIILWILAKAEFLAFILGIVYLGAVIVMFLFVLMLFPTIVKQFKLDIWLAVALLLSMLITGILSYFVAFQEFYQTGIAIKMKLIMPAYDLVVIGQRLFTEYLVVVLAIAMLLLGAIVGIIALKPKEIAKCNQ